MIENVFIDLDDTIFDFKACEKTALAQALTLYNIKFTDSDISTYSKINDDMWKMLEVGAISREELKHKRFDIFFSGLNVFDIDTNEFANTYMDRLGYTDSLIVGALDLLNDLSSKYRLYAVTNGYKKNQIGRIKCAKIGKFFKKIFISQEIGHVKPEFEFFDYCFSRVPNFSRDRSILIGDSLSSDIKGGNLAGIKTIWYNPHYAQIPIGCDVLPDFIVNDLNEVVKIVDSL